MKVAPSLLAADFLNLSSQIEKVSSADFLHLDVMDGSFVPNISFGFSVIESLARMNTPVLDAHLMVVNPQKWFERLANCGVKLISFHLEASGDKTGEYLEQIKKLGCAAGLAINPDVPVEKLFPYIGKADFFLIMSVFAGFGGQKFIHETYDRIKALKQELVNRGSEALIEVDGGVSPLNIRELSECGVEIAVAGSSVFRSVNPALALEQLRNF